MFEAMNNWIAAIPPGLMIAMCTIAVWEMIWKGIALWKSAKNNHTAWFVCILIFNTIGILPIIYLLGFQKKAKKKK